ncbi:MAG: sulfite exporter TauE/SafE family protein [Rhodospirillales bacterium]|jgi:hypothetical protein
MIDLAIVAVGLVAGLLIGLTSVGGVLVLPALVVLLGLSPHEAIPAAMVSFVAPALMGALIVHRRGQIDARGIAALWSGAIPGSLAGAAVLPWVPVALLLWAIAAMLAVSAARALAGPPAAAGDGTRPAAPGMAALGLFVGIVSALTGTGGPVTLMPILSWRGVDPRRAVPLCQMITPPIAIFASLGYAVAIAPDWRLVGLLALSSTAGLALGTRLVKRVATGALVRIIGGMMAVSALLIVFRLLSG